MFKSLLTIVVGFFFYTSLTFAQSQDAVLHADITFLASDAMQGRETGTPFQDVAAAYIGSRFMQMGLKPMGDSDTYLQTFYYHVPDDPHTSRPKGKEGKDSVRIINVIGMLDFHAQKTIVIGAHFDHLGMGDNGFSLSTEKGIHNGADDNASGVAAIMALARKLKGRSGSAYNYLFISFSGEEYGLWGSNYFTKHPTIDLKNVAAMINLDMVGRMKPDHSVMVGGIGTSPVWTDLLEKNNVSGLQQTFDSSGTGPSDHTSFYFQNIPVLFYFTGQHSDYHKPTDDVEKINFEGVEKIVDNIYALLTGLNQVQEIPFLKTKEEKEQKVELKVTLGIMPDYMYSGTGLRIDGVKEGRPAAQAHLQQGDVILQLGSHEVTDIQSYMKALNVLKPGDKVPVKYLRNEQEQTGMVQF